MATSETTATSQKRKSSRLHRVSLDTAVVVQVPVNEEQVETSSSMKHEPLQTESSMKNKIKQSDEMITKTSDTPTLKRWFSSRQKVVNAAQKPSDTTVSPSMVYSSTISPASIQMMNDDPIHFDNATNKLKEDEDEENEIYMFDGVKYTCYQDMVNAKRQRNQDILEQSGLLSTIRHKSTPKQRPTQKQRGIQAKRSSNIHDNNTTNDNADPTKRQRKSSRLQGVKADGYYIDEERAGRVTIAGGESTQNMVKTEPNTNDQDSEEQQSERVYRNRINDGSPISVVQAIENVGPKWMTSSKDATTFVQNNLSNYTMNDADRFNNDDDVFYNDNNDRPNSTSNIVAKVCPDRIYSVAVHPSTNHTIVCAGDKSGYIGIWNQRDEVADTNEDEVVATTDEIIPDNTVSMKSNEDAAIVNDADDNGGIHLFKPHSSVVCCMEWTGNGSSSTASSNLMSASYDGTIRLFDVQKEQFIQIFATYDTTSNQVTPNDIGYGIEPDVYTNRFWTQHICCDQRNNDCYYISTSIGTVMHIDLRITNQQQKHVTFHEPLSEKKINTVSLHPNGYSMISAGLDNTVALWDVRKFSNSLAHTNHKEKLPIASYNCSRSVNSAYFSPSGKYVVSTTMANKLDVFENIHLFGNESDGKVKTNSCNVQPKYSIKHDNMTGRWLTTFQAVFHPQLHSNELFVVGSMRQPRCIELYHPSKLDQQQGLRPSKILEDDDAITSVLSRFAFHPRTDQMIVCGGNSSGRVTVCKTFK